MLSRELLRKHAPPNVGEQIHINHEGCKAGEDTKRRLYIKRVAGGILGFCHHCSEAGRVTENTHEGTVLRKWLQGDPGSDIGEVTYSKGDPPFNVHTVHSLSIQGLDYLRRYYCDVSDTRHFFYTGDESQVGFKLANLTDNVTGYQVRNLIDKPKYITHYKANGNNEVAWFTTALDTKHALYITEDYISAYRINKDTGNYSLALLRTSMSDKTLNDLEDFITVKGITIVLIWLDPDEAGVKAAAKLYKRLSYSLDCGVCTIAHPCEPKHYDPDSLRHLCL